MAIAGLALHSVLGGNLDIDLLKYDRRILKKEDMKRDYILEEIKDM